MIWLDWVLWHINHCKLSNAKSILYISSSSSCRAASTDIPDPLSLHVSLSFIASGRSSGLNPLSSHSCCMYVRAGRPAFEWPYAGVHRSTSLMISSLLLQQCPACLVRLACIVFVIGGRWPYSWCLVGCCCQDFSILLLTFLYNCRLASYKHFYFKQFNINTHFECHKQFSFKQCSLI